MTPFTIRHVCLKRIPIRYVFTKSIYSTTFWIWRHGTATRDGNVFFHCGVPLHEIWNNLGETLQLSTFRICLGDWTVLRDGCVCTVYYWDHTRELILSKIFIEIIILELCVGRYLFKKLQFSIYRLSLFF